MLKRTGAQLGSPRENAGHLSPSSSSGTPTRPLEGNVFSARARRVGLAWVGAALILTALSATQVRSARGYLVLMPLTSALFTVPAIATAVAGVRRVKGPLAPFWRWYLASLCSLFVLGSGVGAYTSNPRGVYLVVVVLGLVVVVVCDALAVDQVIRTRWGGRSRSVDVVESLLAVVAIGAPGVVLNGDEILTARYRWFAFLSVVFLALFISVLWCTVVLFVRSPKGRRRAEGVAVALWFVAVLDALVSIEQVVSDFTLPAMPMMTLNGMGMGLLVIMPLYAQHLPARGSERLPAQARIRTGRVISAVSLGSLPVLAGSVVAAGGTSTSVQVAAISLGLLVALLAMRQVLTFSETRRLYAEVERSAEERRELLAAVVESIDAGRRRMAMQLHEQAASSYAALASLVPAPQLRARRSDEWGPHLQAVPAPLVSHAVTERMAAQAESLRELIKAIRPVRSGSGLAPILQAYVDSLDDGVRPVSTCVEVSGELVLDWVTETVVLRVVQEAVHNTCRHAQATELRIILALDGPVPVLWISDDGVGFDVDGLVVESGIAAMRRFVSFCGGQLSIRSDFGRGTMVEARLGGPVPEVPAPVRLRPV